MHLPSAVNFASEFTKVSRVNDISKCEEIRIEKTKLLRQRIIKLSSFVFSRICENVPKLHQTLALPHLMEKPDSQRLLTMLFYSMFVSCEANVQSLISFLLFPSEISHAFGLPDTL